MTNHSLCKVQLLILLALLPSAGALLAGSGYGSPATSPFADPTPAFPPPTRSVLWTPTAPGPQPTPAHPPAAPTPGASWRPERLATTWYVDTSVAASGDGQTPATAFKTIGEATAVAQSSDTIRVASGIYTEHISLPAGVQMIGTGWPTTILDGGGTGTVLYPGANASVEGFTLRGSGADYFDSGAWISVGPVTMRNNRITSNRTGVFLWCFDPTCPAVNVFINNLFDHNTARGLDSNGPHHFTAINNTFSHNGSGLSATRDYQTIVNNAVVGNGVGLCGETGYSPVAHHNLVWGNDTDYAVIGPGTGDVNADPRFVDPDQGDYSLQLGSPGRDTGDPSSAYNDRDGTRNDMGAFGGPYLIDYTPPPTPTVHDRGTVQPFTATLQITWEGHDLQSGMLGYQVALGTTPAATDTINWTAVGVITAHIFTGLHLTPGLTYYASVQGQNGMGAWSAVGSSDGVLIDLTADDDLAPPTIADVAYNTPAHIADTIIVTAAITDQGEVPHGVFSATLYYGYDLPYSQAYVTGVGPDGNGDGVWQFLIPAQGAARAGQRLRFWLAACDGDTDSPACATDDHGGQYYRVAISTDLTPEPFRLDRSPEMCDYPDFQGDRVVYEDHRGPGIEIYGRNLNTGAEFQVIHDTSHQHFPVVYGDVVAYTDLRYSTTGLDGTDIFATNLATGQEFTVTVAPGQQINLAIGPRYIVWEDDRDGITGSGGGSNRDIYGYDMVTGHEFPIATGSASQLHPDIDGSRVVWSEDGDIVGRDMDTGADFVVSTNFANQLRPAICSDLVVWEDGRHSNWDIYGYRFSTGTEFPIAVAPGDQNFADLSDKLVVWQDMRHGNWDVYVHVIETGEQFPALATPASKSGRPWTAPRWCGAISSTWSRRYTGLSTTARSRSASIMPSSATPRTWWWGRSPAARSGSPGRIARRRKRVTWWSATPRCWAPTTRSWQPCRRTRRPTSTPIPRSTRPTGTGSMP